jgi:hypothetical protein
MGEIMLRRAVTRIRTFLGSSDAARWERRLEIAVEATKGLSRKLRLIAAAGDAEQIRDLLAEVRYAEVFHNLGFSVEFLQDDNLPDMRIAKGDHEIYAEVKRFRIVPPGPPILPKGEFDVLEEYGNPARDIRKVLQNIEGKFHQLPSADSVIAIWNNDGDMEEIEVKEAVDDLCVDRANGLHPSFPEKFLFVVYGSPWLHCRNSKQFFCFPVKSPLERWCQGLMVSLEKVHTSD